MKNTTSDKKGTPAILQDRTGTYNVRVSHYNDSYAAVWIGDDSCQTIVRTENLIFLDNLI